MREVRLLDHPFEAAAEIDRFVRAMPQAGGMASFVGQVRPGDDVRALELTHYEPLTLAGMERLGEETEVRFALDGLLIVHRCGTMAPGEPIVLVAAAARHRRAAIEAVDFAMDHLKSASWFWKREQRVDGWHWIEPREQDHRDLARWQV